MFEKREVKIRLITPMLGTVTKDPTVYKTYIESKKPTALADEDESSTVPADIEARGWTGFHADEKGLFVYDYLIKGFLKHAGNVLKDQLKTKALRSKLDDQLFILPRRVYLGKMAPNGVLERPLRAMTMQGPRVTLARSDYVADGVEISFEVRWIEGGVVNEKLIRSLLAYGEMMGLGQFRNGGYGRFEVVSVETKE